MSVVGALSDRPLAGRAATEWPAGRPQIGAYEMRPLGVFSEKKMNEKFICVTNRKLVEGDFLSWLDLILDRGVNGLPAPDRLILREKDLSPADYTSLARRVLDLCSAKGKLCILHSYPESALELGCEHIHLPLEKLRHMSEEEKSFFWTLGASVHSPEEAREAEALGANYVTFGHVFVTDCKKGLEPRGLEALGSCCAGVACPVYAIGGISEKNYRDCLKAGAAGVCVMSGYMRAAGDDTR